MLYLCNIKIKNTDMTATEIKRNVMLIAHRTYRTKRNEIATFAQALRLAWSFVKEEVARREEAAKGVKASVIRETEKAVMVAAKMVNVKKGEEVSVNVWCPKKLLVSGYIPTWFWSQKEKEMNFHYDFELVVC